MWTSNDFLKVSVKRQGGQILGLKVLKILCLTVKQIWNEIFLFIYCSTSLKMIQFAWFHLMWKLTTFCQRLPFSDTKLRPMFADFWGAPKVPYLWKGKRKKCLIFILQYLLQDYTPIMVWASKWRIKIKNVTTMNLSPWKWIFWSNRHF